MEKVYILFDDTNKYSLRKPVAYIIDDNNCWICTNGKTSDGYGQIYREGKKILLHRFSYELANSCKLKKGEQVMHTCDNPSCINPKHLVKGTQKDNMRDAYNKGRLSLPKPTGESIKLTNEEVIFIYTNNTLSRRQLMKMFNISKSTISKIKTKKQNIKLLNNINI